MKLSVADILATIDRNAFDAIVARWGESSGPDDERRQKYLDLEKWITVNLRRVQRLGLDSGHTRRVVDLGCGCGYFLYICKLLRHDVMGVDRKERSSLFVDVRAMIAVPWTPHTVKAFEPLPDLGRVDVLTAHMVTFNGHRTKPWGPREWEWLLDHVGAPLVSIELNREPDGTLFPPGLREMFVARGARIADHRVLIDRR